MGLGKVSKAVEELQWGDLSVSEVGLKLSPVRARHVSRVGPGVDGAASAVPNRHRQMFVKGCIGLDGGDQGFLNGQICGGAPPGSEVGHKLEHRDFCRRGISASAFAPPDPDDHVFVEGLKADGRQGVAAACEDKAVATSFQNQFGKLAAQGTVHELNSKSIYDENTVEQEKVKVVSKTFKVQGNDFEYSFPAHSFTQLVIPITAQ